MTNKSGKSVVRSWQFGLVFFFMAAVGSATYFVAYGNTSENGWRGLLYSLVVAMIGGVVAGLAHRALLSGRRTQE